MTFANRGDSMLRVIGCGDAFCSGGRHQTCFKLNFRGQVMLLDFGASALAPLRQVLPNLDLIDQIVISHLHGDHFGGLPFFLLDAQFASRRQRPLTVVGPRGTQRRIESAIKMLFPEFGIFEWHFPLRIVELEPGIEQTFDRVSIRAFRADHAAPSTALSFRMEFEDRIFSFSGDTAWTDTLIDVARDADLFVCECYGYQPSHVKHLDWQTLREWQGALTARRILLTHLGPSMIDRLPFLDAGRFEFAVDGMSVDF